MKNSSVPLLLLGLYLLGRNKPANAPPVPAPQPNSTPERLLARANQRRAQEWIPVLERAGATAELARGLARWIGIESGGDPNAGSSMGERGLLQIMESSAKGVLTASEWERMGNPSTDREEHARIALKQYAHHVDRANVPSAADTPSELFYAKLHHSYPADLRRVSARPSPTPAVYAAILPLIPPQRKKYADAAWIVAHGTLPPTGVV